MAKSKEKGGEGGETSKFSESDMKFATTFFSFLETRPEINWEAFAQTLKFKDAEIAKVRFRQIHKKLRIDASQTTDNGEEPSTASPLKSPGKVQKKKGTPRKAQAKKTGKLATALAKEEDDDAKMDDVGKKEEDFEGFEA
ncbi:hypothetical protein F5Y18DRAFT_359824 [Xylariaceae sp. FL1019]|nr:hypothetical protein F5Y18DRAFT_359824 [Xylariaceae sp. FL1019]